MDFNNYLKIHCLGTFPPELEIKKPFYPLEMGVKLSTKIAEKSVPLADRGHLSAALWWGRMWPVQASYTAG